MNKTIFEQAYPHMFEIAQVLRRNGFNVDRLTVIARNPDDEFDTFVLTNESGDDFSIALDKAKAHHDKGAVKFLMDKG